MKGINVFTSINNVKCIKVDLEYISNSIFKGITEIFGKRGGFRAHLAAA